MAAGNFNLSIDQGSNFSIGLTISEDTIPKNLTGYEARAQMRTKKSSDTITASFVCTITDAVNGVLVMSMANSVTELIDEGKYYYDLELFTAADAQVSRLLQGSVNVDAEVTR
jgi:hypothetical protein